MRVGIGYDVHAFEPGDGFKLGGVFLAHNRSLSGHSDADVLLHAIGDALLGAAALGDLGRFFPDSDSEWKDADSALLLARILEMVVDAGYALVNVDATVVAEAPRLAEHIPGMEARIADVLKVTEGQVSVKATTSEQMGFLGREEGIAAHAICLLEKRDPQS